MFHKENIIAYLSQKVCVWVRLELKKVEGLLRGENVRKVFGKVQGARWDKRHSSRMAIFHAVYVCPNPSFFVFLPHFRIETT